MVDEEGIATLIIKNITMSAQGQFSCFAKNDHGTDERFTKLSIRDATRLVAFVPITHL